tara:strand:- start:300 stop:869 length:570 start_codon:yes stop_codon:yes gene_type:complete
LLQGDIEVINIIGSDIMKIDNWTINTNKVRAWSVNQEPCDNLTAVMLSLQLGDNCDNDELRSTYWTAIRSIGSTLEGFPAARRGRESSLTTEQTQNVSIAEELVAAAMNAIPTEYHAILLALIVPHGRTGGVFEHFSDLVANSRKQGHNYMLTSIKEERWNGLDMDEGVPQIAPRPTGEEKDESEEIDG